MCSGSNRGGRGARRATFSLRPLGALRLLLFFVPGVASAQQPLTFYKDIAPIVWTRCASCHRPGEIGPFSLLTYDDVRGRAAQIAAVTARRIMPPWKPEPGAGPFQNERRLADDELQKLQRWIADGAPAGDRSRPTQTPPLWFDG